MNQEIDLIPQIQKYLVKILKSERMVQSVVLTDSTGLTLTSVSKDKEVISHSSAIGSLACALYSGSAAHGQDLLGNLELMLSEYKDGKIFLKKIQRNAIIVVVTKIRANLYKIRYAMKRYGKEISALLKSSQLDHEPVFKKDENLISKALAELEF